MSKELLILIDGADLEKVDNKLLERCDRLAFSSFAMLAFSKKQLSFKTVYDFYPTEEFRPKIYEIADETQEFLAEVDKPYTDLLGYPRAFTGTICQIAHCFINIHFMAVLCERIKSQYSHVYLVSTPVHAEPIKKNVFFTSSGLTFGRFFSKLNYKVALIKKAIAEVEVIYVDKSPYQQRFALLNKYKWINMPQRMFAEGATLLTRFYKRKLVKGCQPLFAIQEGYDVSLLEKYLKNAYYVNPIVNNFHVKTKESPKPLNIGREYIGSLSQFSAKWFPGLEGEASDLFDEYYQKIVLNIHYYFNNIKEKFDECKPRALLFSAYAHNVLQDLYAYEANKRDIPVFYFQHGGTRIFTMNENDNYHEQNKNIKKINLFDSRVELEMSRSNVSSDSKAFGSIKRYKMYEDENKRKRRKNNRVLYCIGPNPFNTFRDIACHMPDKQIFSVQEDLLSETSKAGLRIDIKLNPVEEAAARDYFKELIEYKNVKNARLLSGFPVDRVIANYGLIVMDYVATALLPTCAVLNVPVVFYLKDTAFLRQETFKDLQDRFYIVKDANELNGLLRLYAQGKLKSKLSEDFIDKYVFPIHSGNPVKPLTSFIMPYFKYNQIKNGSLKVEDNEENKVVFAK